MGYLCEKAEWIPPRGLRLPDIPGLGGIPLAKLTNFSGNFRTLCEIHLPISLTASS